MKNALVQLQQILGKNAKMFERVVKVLEKSKFSGINAFGWYRNDFEKSTLSLLKRLDIAFEQMEILSGNEQVYADMDEYAREKFLNLAMDLLKAKIITFNELETALKEPEKSDLPWLLNSLRNEAKELFSVLVIGYPEENENPVEQKELEELLITARKRVA